MPLFAQVKLNHGNVRKVLRSPEVMANLLKRGERIAQAAGPGFVAEPFTGRNRDRVTVRADSDEAKVALIKNPDVLRNAIRAGRG